MKKYSYYNDSDLFVCEWTKNLIRKGLIPDGEVDDRDMRDVQPDDVKPFAHVHFCSGIAGWAYALRLAGWADDRECWTGSMPCQPFSAAGGRKGFDDERHLWPAFFHLIGECRPAIVFGEQVASKDGLAWLDLVQADLEGAGYAVGAADLCAASVGAPHIRQRLWWVAYTETLGRGSGRAGEADRPQVESRGSGDAGWPAGSLGDDGWGLVGAWDNADWFPCRDGKARPVEPGTFPLASRIPGRVGRLRAYGNAIVPQVAAGFVACFVESSDRKA